MGATPWEAKCRVPATQAIRYALFFEHEQNERPPELWYLAQIASILECIPFRVWGKLPPEELTKIKNHLLKFGPGDPEQRELTDEEKSERADIKSKLAWAPIIGRADEPPPEGRGRRGGRDRTNSKLPAAVQRKTAAVRKTPGPKDLPPGWKGRGRNG